MPENSNPVFSEREIKQHKVVNARNGNFTEHI